MCADRIEITEKCNTPVVIGSIKVLKNKLNHIFCCAVRIGRAADFHCFIERRRIVHSVNGSRWAENYLLAACVTHSLAKRDRSADVVFIIFKRLSNAFADSLESRKVNNSVNLVLGKNLVKTLTISDIALAEGEILSCKLFNSFEYLGRAVIEIIENNHLIACV